MLRLSRYLQAVIIAGLTLPACTNVPEDKEIRASSNMYNEENTEEAKAPAFTGASSVAEIEPPEGYSRKRVESFGEWLRKLPLKNDNTVYLYNGAVKPNQTAQYAVIDISVGDRDLQQCADAIMRLRAEYLLDAGKKESIVFYDNEGGEYRYTGSGDRPSFDKYLIRVFGMCGTASLSKQMNAVDRVSSVKTGDVFIKGGFPGHAVMVVDIAENRNGEKMFLLAQSYMPAQNIHILKNPMDKDLSPWYKAVNGADIQTPEYFFTANQLKTW